MDPFDMARFRQFYAEQVRQQEAAEPAADAHARQRTPARPDEATGPLQGLLDLRANRQGVDSAPGEARRAPRAGLGDARPVAGPSRRMRPAGLLQEQVIDSRLRIDHARGPQQARMSDAAMLQHMIGLLERLERGTESLASLVEGLPVDVGILFRINPSRYGPIGLHDDGRKFLHRQLGGDALVQRFDRAVASAPPAPPARRPAPAIDLPAEEVRGHMMDVLEGLRNGRALRELLTTVPPQIALNFRHFDLSPCGRELVSGYGNGVLREFDRALDVPTARARPPANAGTAVPDERRMAPPRALAPRDMPGPSRRTVETVLMNEGLEKASAQLLDPGSGMADIAYAAGVSEEQLRDFFTEDGPTQRGWQLLARCNLTTQATVMQNVVQAQQRRAAFRAEQAQPEAIEPAAALSEHSSPDTPTAGALIGGGLLNASHAFLDPYASMADVANAAGVSEEALRRYFTEDGLTEEGVSLLSDCTESVQAAIAGNVSKGNEDRAAFWRDRQILASGGMMRASTAFLRPEASMTDIANAAGVSEGQLRRYFTGHGLTDQGVSLLSECPESIRSAVENNVMFGSGNRVMWRQEQTRRTSRSLVNGGLMRASTEFLKPGASMADVARAAGVSEEQLRDFFTEDGPTEKGWELASRCSESVQVAIMHNIGVGNERRSALRREQAERAAMEPPAQILPDPSSSFVVPDSAWTGWDLNQSPLHDDVTGPARFAPPEMPDPMYQGFPSSGWPHAGGPQQPPTTPYSQGMGPAGQILPDPSSSFVVPDSNWTGWGFNQSPPHDEVTGPARPPQREATDSAWEGMRSLSGSIFDLNTPYDEVTGPARWQEPAASSDSLYGDAQGLYGASTSYAGPSGHAAYSQPAWAGAVPAQPAPEIIDVESYQLRRPEQRLVGVAERLRNPRAWLRDDDIMTYTGLMIHRLGESLGENGQALINQRLNVVGPLDVHTLRTGDAESRERVRRSLTGPILLVPVHRATEGNRNDHWSLLVVNRASPTPRAYHFDSMVPREYVREAGSLEAFQDQFQVAREVANALGVPELIGRPMAEQEDGHSCGDHVIAGIEELAHRIVHHREGERMSWNLSRMRRPNRQHIVDTLAHHEQFLAQANASGAPPQRLHTDAGPSRRRR